MLHADALERLADAATERHGLERVLADPSSDPELRDHVASCAQCQREVRAWQQTTAALLLAAPGAASVPDDLEAIAPPLSAEARERLLAAARQSPKAALPGPAPEPADTVFPLARRGGRLRWVALAAAAALVAVFVLGAFVGGSIGARSNQSADELRAALAASGKILSQPDHRQAPLVDAAGTAVGSVIVDGQSGDIVVLATSTDGDQETEYHCYLVRDGTRTWLGEMQAQAGATFWAGQVDDVEDLGRTGDVIQVTGGSTEPEFTATF
jgi:hypothetical protein